MCGRLLLFSPNSIEGKKKQKNLRNSLNGTQVWRSVESILSQSLALDNDLSPLLEIRTVKESRVLKIKPRTAYSIMVECMVLLAFVSSSPGAQRWECWHSVDTAHIFFYFCLYWDSSLWYCVAHFQGVSSLCCKPLWKHLHRHICNVSK